MKIDDLIEKYQEKHSRLLSEYMKGNANGEVMRMLRSQMTNILGFIDDLKQFKNDNILLPDKVFALANELAVAGYGKEAVRMHEIHNDLHPGHADNMLTIPTMPIIHVTTPGFEHKGVGYQVSGRMYGDLRSFQDDILRHQATGYNICFLYSIFTEDGPNGIILYFVRCLFTK